MALSGEMTNGGFDTMRSKRSPFTGSKKLPARHSTLSAPLSRALNAVKLSARGFRSHAITLVACRAVSTAWTPHPQPMSSARSTGCRTVSEARRSELLAQLCDARPVGRVERHRRAAPLLSHRERDARAALDMLTTNAVRAAIGSVR